jgi:hypothetical protein
MTLIEMTFAGALRGLKVLKERVAQRELISEDYEHKRGVLEFVYRVPSEVGGERRFIRYMDAILKREYPPINDYIYNVKSIALLKIGVPNAYAYPFLNRIKNSYIKPGWEAYEVYAAEWMKNRGAQAYWFSNGPRVIELVRQDLVMPVLKGEKEND